jgi:23S rRNA (guanosine2251-2'-O)-methyltransferase
LKIKKTGRAGKSGFHKEWIYGLNPVREAVRAGRDIKLIIISTSRKGKNSGIEKELSSSGIKIKIEDSLFFNKRFPKGHQGIAAAVIPRKYSDFEEMLNIPSRKGEVPVFLILDCLEDPRNFGAILRVADAGGIHGVVIQSRRSATLVPEAVKASAGASEYVPIAMVPNIKHAIQHMKDIGLTIIGAEAGEGKTIWDLNLNG